MRQRVSLSVWFEETTTEATNCTGSTQDVC